MPPTSLGGVVTNDLDLIYQTEHLFDSPGLGLLVTDMDWRILHVNLAFSSMMNLRPADMARRSMEDLVLPDFMPYMEEARRQCMDGKANLHEIRLRAGRGDLHVRISAAPLHQDGRVVGCIFFVVDIDDLCKANRELERQVDEMTAILTRLNERLLQEIEAGWQTEERLRRSNARYRALVEIQPLLVCRILPDGTFTYVSRAFCRFIGMGEDELLGRSIVSLSTGSERPRAKAIFSALIREMPDRLAFESRLIDASGKMCRIKWSLKAIAGEFGREVEYQMVGIDITEGERIAEVLAKR